MKYFFLLFLTVMSCQHFNTENLQLSKFKFPISYNFLFKLKTSTNSFKGELYLESTLNSFYIEIYTIFDDLIFIAQKNKKLYLHDPNNSKNYQIKNYITINQNIFLTDIIQIINHSLLKAKKSHTETFKYKNLFVKYNKTKVFTINIFYKNKRLELKLKSINHINKLKKLNFKSFLVSEQINIKLKD